MSFIWKLAIFSVIQDFTGFTSTVNSKFEITFFNALFNLIESLIDAQFARAFCFFDKCTNFFMIS